MKTAFDLETMYHVRYFQRRQKEIVTANPDNLYFFQTFVGEHEINIQLGDCLYFFSDDLGQANQVRGPAKVLSKHVATIIRGYMPDNKTSSLIASTHLPYINGCSTKQIFPPERIGDPTLQMLIIPPYTKEQAHHIHSTARVVYVLSGSGKSIVGMKNHCSETRLETGMVVVLDKMCPHHFETDESELVVIPLHVFSSAGQKEYNHPMYNGTFQVED